MNLSKILTTVIVAAFVLVGGAGLASAQTATTTASGEITNPANDGDEVSGTTTLTATYDDGNDKNEGISWAVKTGTCEANAEEEAGTETVFGNVDGHNDNFSFNDGESFSSDFDTTDVEDGDYCFIFNPDKNDDVDNDLRLTRDFTINNSAEAPQCEAGFTINLQSDHSWATSVTDIAVGGETGEGGDEFSLFASGDTDASTATSGTARIERTSNGELKLYFNGGDSGDWLNLRGSLQFDDVDFSNVSTSTISEAGLESGAETSDTFEIDEENGVITFDLYVSEDADSFVISGLDTECDETDDDGNDNEEADEPASSGGGGGGGSALSSRGGGDVAGDRDENSDNDGSDGEVLGEHDEEAPTDEELTEMLNEARGALMNLLQQLQTSASVGFPNTGDGSFSLGK